MSHTLRLKDVANDSANLKVCNCGLAKTVVEHVDLTDDPTVVSSADGSAVVSNTLMSTPLYTLHAHTINCEYLVSKIFHVINFHVKQFLDKRPYTALSFILCIYIYYIALKLLKVL